MLSWPRFKLSPRSFREPSGRSLASQKKRFPFLLLLKLFLGVAMIRFHRLLEERRSQVRQKAAPLSPHVLADSQTLKNSRSCKSLASLSSIFQQAAPPSSIHSRNSDNSHLDRRRSQT